MSVKILFVGNSHTYLFHMPEMLVSLSKAGGHQVNVSAVTGEGVDLSWHWTNRQTKTLIKSGRWDYVVLQERSGGPLEAEKSMADHARLLHNLIKTHGAKTILFMTWAHRLRPETQKAITGVYAKLAGELGALPAPVGPAWEKSLVQNPDLRLHHKDGRHAGRLGAYLTACVFFPYCLSKARWGCRRY